MLLLRDRAARVAALALAGLSVVVFCVCAWASYRRHLHVDEISGLYAIQLGAAFGHPEYGSIELSTVLFRPLAWWLGSSERLFVGFRALELALLFGLCGSIAVVQSSLPSALGRAGVFLGAVTFGPLWRHGFELRHDMFVAYAVVLLAWAGERARADRLDLWAASVTAFGVIIVQANSLKAFTIWVPGLALCALLAARGKRPWLANTLSLGLRFLPGVIAGCVVVTAVLGSAGMLGEFWRQIRHFASYSSAPPYRLSALPLLTFGVERAPVHAGFVLLGVLGIARRTARREPLAEAWVPLAACVLSGISILLNPTPFPYNLTWLSPAWLSMSAFGLSQSLTFLARVRAGAVPIFVFASGALSLFFFWRCEQDPYYRKDWDAQLRVVASAEALTSPDDPVLDLTGLVVSRPPVAKDWVVHSLFMPAYRAGQRETVRAIIARVAPPIAISSYRWSFLDREDWLSFRRNYVRFSDDVWVLGRFVAPNTTELEIPRTGRYRVRGDDQAGRIDGNAIGNGEVRSLARGRHATITREGYTLSWVGPGSPGAPPPTARPLFVPGELPKQRDDR